MQFVTRKEWGARAPRNVSRRIYPERGGVALHWNGPGMGPCEHSECAKRVRGIQNFHMDTRKWSDIAYSLFVCPHGYVYEGRGAGVRTAANGTNDGNDRFYAVYVLAGEDDPFTDEARTGVIEAIEWLREHGNAGPQVVCHSDLKGTACPGPVIRAWVRSGTPIAPHPHKPAPPISVEVDLAKLPLLRRGSTGQIVKNLQALLVAAGRTLVIDGDFGPTTERVLREWQAAAGIGSDGICGPQTWAVLLGAH